ncbi:hypothetical protein KAM622c_12600 [Klebsiella quasipneumoniae subsp. quasipneumoniae]|nr:hypothetical protein KAM622c_12600 [Klebsiella quasipneumoniae subsp. quasipneumoniae]
MHVGGDITYRNLTYSVGGKWADEKGNEKDVLSILQDNAFNPTWSPPHRYAWHTGRS